jgi:DNA-binding NarL/FixJ family response regulator
MPIAMKVIVAADDPLCRAALREAITRVVVEPRIREADSLAALEDALLDNPDTDVILVDTSVVDIHGFSALVHLCVRHPSIAVAMTSAADGATVVCSSLASDSSGAMTVSGSIEQIHKLLHGVFDGVSMLGHQLESSTGRNQVERDPARNVSRLSPQQLRVLMSLAGGLSNKTIAQDLGVTEATIKAHMTGILRKLGLERRTQAALLAQRILRTPMIDMRERGKSAA